MEELNLCKLLKNYQGEIFYNPLLGSVKVTTDDILVHIHYGRVTIDIAPNGKDNDGNMALFPSVTQRDWTSGQ